MTRILFVLVVVVLSVLGVVSADQLTSARLHAHMANGEGSGCVKNDQPCTTKIIGSVCCPGLDEKPGMDDKPGHGTRDKDATGTIREFHAKWTKREGKYQCRHYPTAQPEERKKRYNAKLLCKVQSDIPSYMNGLSCDEDPTTKLTTCE